MKELEITAATVEQAIEKAEAQLGLSRDKFRIEIVREGKSGILGLGSKEAVIRVSPLVQSEMNVSKVAKEVLTTILELIGVSGKVEVVSDGIPLALDIKGEDLGILIGRRGQTLAALEYLTKLVVAGQLKAWLPLTVDVAGYKKRRYDSLRRLALQLAEQVKTKRRAITMEPMPPDERRVIHLTLADNPDVTTRSIGEGENRKVVILLRQS
jgi:spoIIIJ-associated protein